MRYSFPDNASICRKREISRVVSLSMGNGLEYYNFVLYVFFAPFIGATFFDLGPGSHTLLSALIAFGSGFLFRPLGAFVMGRMAAKRGEMPVLVLTFLLMGMASLGFVLLPGARRIGMLAPIMVFVFRAIQGFAEGGEIGPATQMLYATSTGRRQVANASMQYITQYVASLVAALVGTLVSVLFPEGALADWGWRLPFLIGSLVAVIGLRLRVGQSIRPQDRVGAAPVRMKNLSASDERADVFSWTTAALILCVVSASALTTYVRSFGVSYAMGQLHATAFTSLVAMTVGIAAGLAAMITGIALYHRVSRRLILLGTIIATELSVLPAYLICIRHPSLPTLLLLNSVTYWLSGITSAISIMTILRAIPAERRSLLFGMLYTMAVSVFGGLAQPVMEWAIDHTGWLLLPAFTTMLASPIGLVALLVLLGRSQEPPVSRVSDRCRGQGWEELVP
ncbi:MAG: MFS transporter [Gluconacetobacter liquefaciens]